MEDEASYPGAMNSKYRFDQLIKTMIARIEYNNTLAPVQEYGRHQTRALKNKKKKAGGNAQAANGQEDDAEGKKNKKDYDDRFYDLDDNFIDDEDMEDDYGRGLEGIMENGGAYDDMNDDFAEDDPTSQNQPTSLNVEYDPLADE